MPSTPINNSNPSSISEQQNRQYNAQADNSCQSAVKSIALASHLQSLGVNTQYVIVDDCAKTHAPPPSVSLASSQLDRRPAPPSRWNSVITTRTEAQLLNAVNRRDAQPTRPVRERPQSDSAINQLQNSLRLMQDSLRNPSDL